MTRTSPLRRSARGTLCSEESAGAVTCQCAQLAAEACAGATAPQGGLELLAAEECAGDVALRGESTACAGAAASDSGPMLLPAEACACTAALSGGSELKRTFAALHTAGATRELRVRLC